MPENEPESLKPAARRDLQTSNRSFAELGAVSAIREAENCCAVSCVFPQTKRGKQVQGAVPEVLCWIGAVRREGTRFSLLGVMSAARRRKVALQPFCSG